MVEPAFEELDKGRRVHWFTVHTTKAMNDVIREVADKQEWSLSQTINELVKIGLRSFEKAEKEKGKA